MRSICHWVFVLLLVYEMVQQVDCTIMMDARRLRTIGTARKDVSLTPHVETLLHLESVDSPSFMNMMWFTGELLWLEFPRVRVRMYVDGELTPSVEFELFSGHGIAFESRDFSMTPYGNIKAGKLGFNGGLYSRRPVPFGASLRITAALAADETRARTFYFMCRGLSGVSEIPLDGGIALPVSARLRTIALHAPALKPTEWVALANVTGTGGLLESMFQEFRSGNAHYLEGEHIALLDGRRVPISSGTEDGFLSCQYFDAGEFSTPLAGMTYENHFIEPSVLGAYRVFSGFDPVVFHDNFTLLWQNGRHLSGPLTAKQTDMKSLIFLYQWKNH